MSSSRVRASGGRPANARIRPPGAAEAIAVASASRVPTATIRRRAAGARRVRAGRPVVQPVHRLRPRIRRCRRPGPRRDRGPITVAPAERASGDVQDADRAEAEHEDALVGRDPDLVLAVEDGVEWLDDGAALDRRGRIERDDASGPDPVGGHGDQVGHAARQVVAEHEAVGHRLAWPARQAPQSAGRPGRPRPGSRRGRAPPRRRHDPANSWPRTCGPRSRGLPCRHVRTSDPQMPMAPGGRPARPVTS